MHTQRQLVITHTLDRNFKLRLHQHPAQHRSAYKASLYLARFHHYIAKYQQPRTCLAALKTSQHRSNKDSSLQSYHSTLQNLTAQMLATDLQMSNDKTKTNIETQSGTILLAFPQWPTQVKDGKILAAPPSLHLRPRPREILAHLAPAPEPGVRQHDPQTMLTAPLDECVVHQGIKTAMTKVPPAACVFAHSCRAWRRKCRTELESFQIRSRQRCWRS